MLVHIDNRNLVFLAGAHEVVDVETGEFRRLADGDLRAFEQPQSV